MTDPTDRARFETEMLRYMSPGSLERFGEGYAFHNISWAAWQAALATQRAEIERLTELVRWSYSKLHHRDFQRLDDALKLDEMKLLLEHGI
jgi:hypothetical protein